jgi:diguanylate cyclase (GGDEF)-like protein
MLELGAFFIGRELELKMQIEGVYWEVDRADSIFRLVQRIVEAAERFRESGIETISRRDEIYRITAESVRDHLDARRVLLIQVQPEKKVGRIAWEARESAAFEKREGWEALGDSMVEWVARKGDPSEVRASSGLSPLPPCWSDPEDGNALLLPVSLTDGFVGVMACLSRAGEEGAGKGEFQRGEQFLNVMRMGISHTEEVERLASEAQRDGLTGLLNRKTYCTTLDKVLSRLDLRRPCAVIMLDIDHFKRINDGYGHPAGDEVIRTVAEVIERTVRKNDFAGRYGGEEFVLYLDDVDPVKAMQAAERLRLLIRNVKYNFSGKELCVTASMGVACYPEHGTLGEELLKRADEGLYRSKAAGRDRATLYAMPG